MDLPLALRQRIEAVLTGVSAEALAAAGARLSSRYRAEILDGRLHLGDDAAAFAYIATRMPATFAAVRRAMELVAEAEPDFSPRSLLDTGAGPGTALWATADCWPDLAEAMLLEASPHIRKLGQQLAEDCAVASVNWAEGRAETQLADAAPADLVTLCYVLDELAEPLRERLVAQLWALTRQMLLIVEPGTPAGWRRVLAARAQLLAAGAHLVAPCPHAGPCGVIEPDWCHFAVRLARSRMHRLAKGADAPFEDEKFIYLAASRAPASAPVAARVLAPPRAGSGKVQLKLCQSDGRVADVLLTRRDGAQFKAARRLGWGDGLG